MTYLHSERMLSSAIPTRIPEWRCQRQQQWRHVPVLSMCWSHQQQQQDQLPDFSNGVLSNARIVLVGTQHAGNVGSVCRVAANFECRDVFLVDPDCDHQSQEGFNAAANTISRDLLQRLLVTESLPQAIEECSMAVAFTRRTGKIRRPSFTLEELIVADIQQLKIALVFGREDCGLHTDELLHCTHVCSIRSGSWQGSLNLSHAVAVVLSRLYESWAPKETGLFETVRLDSVGYKTLPGTASISEVENMLHRWERVFASCNNWAKWGGMPEFKTPDRLFIFLRKLLQRARPSVQEVAYFHGFLSVIEDLATIVSRVDKGHGSDGRKLK